jgi:segregation and condensation protein B
MNKLVKHISTILFYRGSAVKEKDLMDLCQVGEPDLHEALEILSHNLEVVGLTIVRHGKKVSLTTHSDQASIIEDFKKAEVSGPLSNNAVETLAIIAYQAPVRKTDIDFIRGVNSQYILRNLQSRGLIERHKDKNDDRTHVYTPTLALLEYFGVSSIGQLPDYESIQSELTKRKEFLQEQEGLSPE